MEMKWHNDDEAFLLFGAELNKIIAALQYLSDKNPDVEGIDKFIQKLKTTRSYDVIVDTMISNVSADVKKIPKTKLTAKEEKSLSESMSLDEILYRFELKLPKGKNGKN